MNKIGRPKKENALTPAERAKGYRERQKAKRASGKLEPTPAEYRAHKKVLEVDLIETQSVVATLQAALTRANEQVLTQQRRLEELDVRVEEIEGQLDEAWGDADNASQTIYCTLREVAELVRRGDDRGHIDYPRELKELLRRYEFDYEEWLESEIESECDDKLLRDFP